MSEGAQDWQVGDIFEVEVGSVAHGGHCVARHEGRVLFVRHTLPGERVTARITSIGKGGRFVQADAESVKTLGRGESEAQGRVEPPCPYAGAGQCGGCDFQHVALWRQRELKTSVVYEQFQRLAKIDLAAHFGRDIVCQPMPGEDDGLGWRTRVEFAVGTEARAGLRRHHSHDILPIRDCLIAHPDLAVRDVLSRRYPGVQAVDVVGAASGTVMVRIPADQRHETPGASLQAASADTRSAGEIPTVIERVRLPGGEVEFDLSARGFWQVHPAAPRTFAETVLEFLEPAPGERALDLYAGVGLFAAALAQAVGRRGRVVAVESDVHAVHDARGNLVSWPHARVRAGRVDRAVRDLARSHTRADLVVLDPPRVGAGKAVLRDVALLHPRAIAYVACDPAALARDTAYLMNVGWRLADLRVFDAFPMTHHVECLAHFVPVGETRNGN